MYYFSYDKDRTVKYLLDDMEKLISHLLQQTQNQGELFLLDVNAIKVTYDLKSGVVKIEDVEPKGRINNSYSDEFYNKYTGQLKEAIGLIAKLYLFERIHNELKDDKIGNIIHRNHFHIPSQRLIHNLNRKHIVRTFKKIRAADKKFSWFQRRFFSTDKPRSQSNVMHKAIQRVLKNLNLEKIKSKKDVDDLIVKIHEMKEKLQDAKAKKSASVKHSHTKSTSL